MKTVQINTTHNYTISIKAGLLDDCGSIIRSIKKPCEVMIISDDTVYKLYGSRVKAALTAASYTVSEFVFKHGEASKCMDTAIAALNALYEHKITRGGLVVALGGGVTGDLAGFVSAIYMRGIPFVQLPTTLLAAVDSSVGGKTGVDYREAKNLIGAFHQPAAVICDTDTLKTLPCETFKDGLCEVIKYGMINSPELIKLLSQNVEANITNIIYECVKIKKYYVEADEFDTGLRMMLNFGHTVGHAIEKLSDFKLSHGHAVAIGMKIITLACDKLGLTEELCYPVLDKLLKLNGIATDCCFSAEELASAALSDKKINSNTLSLILPKKAGEAYIKQIPVTELKKYIEKGL